MGGRGSRHHRVVHVVRTGPTAAQLAAIRQQEEAKSKARFDEEMRRVRDESEAVKAQLMMKHNKEIAAGVETEVARLFKIEKDKVEAEKLAYWARIEKEQNQVHGEILKVVRKLGGRSIPKSDLTFGDQLGEGAFGIVWEGQYQGQPVAIKKYKQSAVNDISAVRQLEQEFYPMQQLTHDNIAQFVGACVHQESGKSWELYLVVELIDGVDLRSYLHASRLSFTVSETVYMGLQMARAMSYLYSKGIAHRDLKSANIMMYGKCKIKLVDFGLAFMSKVPTDTSVYSIRKRTQATVRRDLDGKSTLIAVSAVGTPLYMSPELHLASDSARVEFGLQDLEMADVFCFCVLLAEILTGIEPFHEYKRADEQSLSLAQLKDVVCRRGLRPTLPQDLPKPLAEMLADGWHSDPRFRPDFAEIVTILESLEVPRSEGKRNENEDLLKTIRASRIQAAEAVRPTSDERKSVSPLRAPSSTGASTADRALAWALADSVISSMPAKSTPANGNSQSAKVTNSFRATGPVAPADDEMQLAIALSMQDAQRTRVSDCSAVRPWSCGTCTWRNPPAAKMCEACGSSVSTLILA